MCNGLDCYVICKEYWLAYNLDCLIDPNSIDLNIEYTMKSHTWDNLDHQLHV